MSEVYEKIVRLKMLAEDRKSRETDVADTEQSRRLGLSCNNGFQPVDKDPAHIKKTNELKAHGKHISPNLPANSVCSKIPQGSN